MNALRCLDVCKSFDGTHALCGITLELPKAGLIAIIGPNGAGKTTLLNVFTGFVRPDRGHVFLGSHDITRLEPYRIARLGLVRTFQEMRLVHALSVLDNVMLGQQSQRDEQLLSALFGLGRRHREAEYRRLACDVLRRVGLLDEDRVDDPAGELSYGQQKLLALAACLAADPRVLFLDEPVAGVDPDMRARILRLLRDLTGDGRLIAFIEHDMDAVREIADRVIVMDDGRVIADGRPDEVLNQSAIMEAYLG